MTHLKMAAPDMLKSLGPDVRQLKLNGHVGFDSLPDQLVSKAVAQGFNFNILCVGETGIGKSTLMETIFNQRFEFCPSSHDLPAVKLKSVASELKEINVKLKLTIVETGGFGDQVNKEDSTKSIIEYIDLQYENYLQEELKIRRALHTFHDTRIHCCIYFICPTGHSLKSIDLVTLRELAKKVNVIPIIAKSDTITKAELSKFKARITSEIQSSDIDIYQFPLDDDTVSESNSALQGYVPFAVVGSNDEVKVGSGKPQRVRQYAWGTVQVENENHCDFVRLREALVRTNMEDLRDRTHSRHYEVYRRQRLQDMGFRDEDKLSLQEMYERRRETHMAELQRKEEDMRQMFVLRVKEKEGELKEAEKELQTRFESVKKQHAEKKRELEEKRRQLDESIADLDRKRQAAEQMRHSTLLKGGKKK